MDIKALEKKIRDGKGDFSDVYALAKASGKDMAERIEVLLKEEFPEGRISDEDVRRIVSPILRENHALVTELMAIVIENMYKKNGIGLKATIPEYSMWRENGIVWEIANRSWQDEFY